MQQQQKYCLRAQRVRKMDERIQELLNKLGFSEHPEKPLLFQKQVDDRTAAYIDFRKEHSGSTKGRRFAKQGEDFIDDPDEIEVLRMFKDEKDRLFEQKEKAEENPVSRVAGDQ